MHANICRETKLQIEKYINLWSLLDVSFFFVLFFAVKDIFPWLKLLVIFDIFCEFIRYKQK